MVRSLMSYMEPGKSSVDSSGERRCAVMCSFPDKDYESLIPDPSKWPPIIRKIVVVVSRLGR